MATRGVASTSSAAASSSTRLAIASRNFSQPFSVPSFSLVAPSTRSIRTLHTTSTARFARTPILKATTEKPSDTRSPEPEPDADAPPPKASLRERLKFLTRRYGWWALGVYLAASAVDFSLTFLAIHLLGADHIRSLESSLRRSIGLEQRSDSEQEDGKRGGGLWTEAVLAYTIHKTLLLPVRVAFTAAVTPSFVKWLVRMGWAKANYEVKAQVGRRAADKAIQDVVKRHAAKGGETVKHH